MLPSGVITNHAQGQRTRNRCGGVRDISDLSQQLYPSSLSLAVCRDETIIQEKYYHKTVSLRNELKEHQLHCDQIKAESSVFEAL